jgi:hypothetical protein
VGKGLIVLELQLAGRAIDRGLWPVDGAVIRKIEWQGHASATAGGRPAARAGAQGMPGRWGGISIMEGVQGHKHA